MKMTRQLKGEDEEVRRDAHENVTRALRLGSTHHTQVPTPVRRWTVATDKADDQRSAAQLNAGNTNVRENPPKREKGGRNWVCGL